MVGDKGGAEMREIKFRAWCKTEEEMISWQRLRRCRYNSKHELARDIDGGGEYLDMFSDDFIILMQYTGLKDKDGKEGYHKDITEDHYMIEWSEAGAAFYLLPLGHPNLQRPILSPRDLQNKVIIGNTYDNPELLEEP